MSSGNCAASSRSSVQILEAGSTKSLLALMAVYMQCPSLSDLHVQDFNPHVRLILDFSREQERLTEIARSIVFLVRFVGQQGP